MCENRFYICEHCGNLVGMINESGVPMMCCGQKMTLIEPGTVEASREKHIPVVSVSGNIVKVEVGSASHPMQEEHSILWVYLKTTKGGQRKCLEIGAEPTATFALFDEDPVAAYAYCNLHGLWKSDIEKKCEPVKVPESKHENYVVCNCNNVSYFDIADVLTEKTEFGDVISAFEQVKDTTHCSTGCGGCYDKVMAIVSDVLMGNNH